MGHVYGIGNGPPTPSQGAVCILPILLAVGRNLDIKTDPASLVTTMRDFLPLVIPLQY